MCGCTRFQIHLVGPYLNAHGYQVRSGVLEKFLSCIITLMFLMHLSGITPTITLVLRKNFSIDFFFKTMCCY